MRTSTGWPTTFFGEVVAAARPACAIRSATVRTARGARSLWCAERLARFKVPKHIRFVPEFPMTASGKIQKFKLRDEHQAELQLAH